MLTLKNTRKFIFGLLFCLLSAGAATAQTTAFTYQGRFTDSTVAQPTNGNYNMQFALFDAVSGGTQIGATVTNTSVQVTNGIFTVSLDYGANSFSGADRFLEIRVFSTTTNNYVVLSPRQQITSAPYAIRALKATTADTATNSTQLGGINANQFVTGQVVRSLNGLTDNVTLAPGSNITITPTGNTLTIASTGGGGSGGILNQTTLQTGANFNIDGTGTANIFNAATQYNIGGSRILSNGGFNNLFAGVGAGSANTTGSSNSFVGRNAGLANMTGFNNSFVGNNAGDENTIGSNNSFFSSSSGSRNTTGGNNSFFGVGAGFLNNTSSNNSFFGVDAGFNNTGGNNSFFGDSAGTLNTTGDNNTIIGTGANVASGDLTFATAIGADALVSTSNTVVLGRTFDDVRVPGNLVVVTLGAAGSTSLCRNASNQISTCTPGNSPDKSGGDNAAAISVLREQIKQQQVLIDGLRKLVCQTNPQADVCKQEK